MRQTLENAERVEITRKASLFGNGAHVFVPKEWAFEEVVVIRKPRKPIPIEIMEVLTPYLDSIIGAYLYGSYARGENNKDSDVDLLIIADKKFKIFKKGFDIITITPNEIESAIKINPILIYSIINEAKPIINSSFLNELKSRKVDIRNFKDFIASTKESLKSSAKLVEFDINKEYLDSNSAVYSLVLRLRGIFIINQLLSGKKYSNKLFEKWIKGKIDSIEYSKVYEIYQAVRGGKKTSKRIKIKDASALLSLTKEEIDKLDKMAQK